VRPRRPRTEFRHVTGGFQDASAGDHQAAADCGQIYFGENKVQEAKAKIPLCPGKLRWHFIGHLQSNKCRDAVELFEMIQSVDSLSLAQEINQRAEPAARRMPVLLEVNVAGEASNLAINRSDCWLNSRKSTFCRDWRSGLMTVPPWSPEAEESRPHFRRLRELKQRAEQMLGAPLPHLKHGHERRF